MSTKKEMGKKRMNEMVMTKPKGGGEKIMKKKNSNKKKHEKNKKRVTST